MSFFLTLVFFIAIFVVIHYRTKLAKERVDKAEELGFFQVVEARFIFSDSATEEQIRKFYRELNIYKLGLPLCPFLNG